MEGRSRVARAEAARAITLSDDASNDDTGDHGGRRRLRRSGRQSEEPEEARYPLARSRRGDTSRRTYAEDSAGEDDSDDGGGYAPRRTRHSGGAAADSRASSAVRGAVADSERYGSRHDSRAQATVVAARARGIWLRTWLEGVRPTPVLYVPQVSCRC